MDNSTGKTLLGLGLGIVIGAAIGVLVAPRSGKETRAAIRRQGKDLKKDMEEMIDTGRTKWSKAKGKMSDVFAAGHDIADKAKKTVEDAKENFQQS